MSPSFSTGVIQPTIKKGDVPRKDNPGTVTLNANEVIPRDTNKKKKGSSYPLEGSGKFKEDGAQEPADHYSSFLCYQNAFLSSSQLVLHKEVERGKETNNTWRF